MTGPFSAATDGESGPSRRLSTSASDYGDCYDLMSYARTCTNSDSTFSSAPERGPSMDAIQLDVEGRIPLGRRQDFDESRPASTITLAALNAPGAPGFDELGTQASVVIAEDKGTSTTSDYCTVELRNKKNCDAGIPIDGVDFHLHGQDGCRTGSTARAATGG